MKVKAIPIIVFLLISSFVFLSVYVPPAQAYTLPGQQVLVSVTLHATANTYSLDGGGWWGESGAQPVLGLDDNGTSYVSFGGNTSGWNYGYFGFEDLPANATSVQTCFLYYSCKLGNDTRFDFSIVLWDGTAWVTQSRQTTLTDWTYFTSSNPLEVDSTAFHYVEAINGCFFKLSSGTTYNAIGYISYVALVCLVWESFTVYSPSTYHFVINMYVKGGASYTSSAYGYPELDLWNNLTSTYRQVFYFGQNNSQKMGLSSTDFQWFNVTFNEDGYFSEAMLNATRLRLLVSATRSYTLQFDYVELMVIRGSRVDHLLIQNFSGTELAWIETGSSPYLNAIDGTNRITSLTGSGTIAESYWMFSQLPPYSPVQCIVDAEDIDDMGADWIFTNWRYYTFTITIPKTSGILNEVALKFTIPTEDGWVQTGYDSDGSDWVTGNNLTRPSRYGDPTTLKAGTWTEDASDYIITFPVWFSERVEDVFKGGVDVWIWQNFTDTGEIDWLLMAPELFRIYSNGAFSQDIQTFGQAGALAGGYYFSYYAYNESSVTRDLWFRDLQHVKFLYEVSCYVGYGTFTQEFGLNYALGDSRWIEGIRLDVSADLVTTGSAKYVNLSAWWTIGSSPMVFQTDPVEISCFHYGGAATGDRTKWYLWVDLWFSDVNGSTVVSGRINAYEYPMKDSAADWMKWLSTNWGVADEFEKESSFSYTLMDNDDNSTITAPSIKMVKLWSSLAVSGDGQHNQYVIVDPFLSVDYTRHLPLDGISTPVFDETKMPVMGNTGFLAAVTAGFARMGTWLSENVLFGGLNMWGTFVNFLDTIASWFNAPHFFSNLFDTIGDFFANFVSGIIYAGTVVTNIFILIGSLLGTFLTTIAELIVSFTTTIGKLLDIMGGAIGGAGNLWNQLGISTWLTVAIIFYPIYLIFLWEEEGMDAVVGQLQMIFGILSWLFDFFVKIGSWIVDAVSGLVESIPIVE